MSRRAVGGQGEGSAEWQVRGEEDGGEAGGDDQSDKRVRAGGEDPAKKSGDR